jgi:hypothetical protein
MRARLITQLCTAVSAENSDSDALVMQTADQGMGHDPSDSLNGAREWRILGQGAVSVLRDNGGGAEVDKRIRLIGVLNIKGSHLATLGSG